LQNAWNDYGNERFEFKIMELTSPEKLTEREQYWIDYFDSYNTGYNLRPKAENFSGYTKSQESKKKISLSLINHPCYQNPERSKNLSNSLKGRSVWNKGKSGYHIHSEEYKNKLRKRMLENNPTDTQENRKKISERNRVRIWTEESLKKKSKIMKNLYSNGWINPMQGRHHTEETRKKQSIRRLANPNQRDKNTGRFIKK
jgi:group I intron endonuclease